MGVTYSTSSSRPEVVQTPGAFGPSQQAGISLTTEVAKKLGFTPQYGTVATGTGKGAKKDQGITGFTGELNIPQLAAAGPMTTPNFGSVGSISQDYGQYLNQSNIQGALPGTVNAANINTGYSSEYAPAMREAILNPTFQPVSQAEQILLQQAAAGADASTAARGMSTPSLLERMRATAPIMAQLRQDRVRELMGAQAQDVGQQQNRIAQELAQRGQTLQADVAQRTDTLQAQLRQEAQRAQAGSQQAQMAFEAQKQNIANAMTQQAAAAAAGMEAQKFNIQNAMAIDAANLANRQEALNNLFKLAQAATPGYGIGQAASAKGFGGGMRA